MNTGTFVLMELLKVLGRNIKAGREALHLSQTALAKLMDIDPSQVSRVEKGKLFIGLSTLERYAQVFGVEPYELLKGQMEPSDLDEQIKKVVAKLSDDDKRLLLLLIDALQKKNQNI